MIHTSKTSIVRGRKGNDKKHCKENWHRYSIKEFQVVFDRVVCEARRNLIIKFYYLLVYETAAMFSISKITSWLDTARKCQN